MGAVLFLSPTDYHIILLADAKFYSPCKDLSHGPSDNMNSFQVMGFFLVISSLDAATDHGLELGFSLI